MTHAAVVDSAITQSHSYRTIVGQASAWVSFPLAAEFTEEQLKKRRDAAAADAAVNKMAMQVTTKSAWRSKLTGELFK